MCPVYRVDEFAFDRLQESYWTELIHRVSVEKNISVMLANHPTHATDPGFARPREYYNCEKMGGCGPGTKRTPRNVCAVVSVGKERKHTPNKKSYMM